MNVRLIETWARRALPARPTLGAALRLAGKRGRGLALLYHRVGTGGNGPHRVVPTLPSDVFREHLEILGNAGTIVPLRELLEAPASRRPVRFAVSFDDDDPGYVEFVLPVLRSLGVRATFFLSGRRLHDKGAYRWEQIERAIARHGAPKVAGLLGLPGADAGEMAAACESCARHDRLQGVVPEEDDVHPMTREHIHALADAGMEIGFHTLDHLLLPEQSSDHIDRVLVEGRDELRAASGQPVDLFAYPFGKADRRTADRVRAAGYEAAFTNRSHTIGAASHPFLLGRWDTRLRSGDEFVSALALRLIRPGAGPKERPQPVPRRVPVPALRARAPRGDRATVPLVTVAIPTYDRADMVGAAIRSALTQTFADFELLVLDDGSEDGTEAVVRAHRDPRLTYVRNPSNLGMTGNWNRGFELARGRYVSLLHDDDQWCPRFLERAVDVFRACPEAGFVYAASDVLYGLGREDRLFSPGEALERLRRRNEVAEEAVLVRRAALLEVGGFRDRWPYSMDWEVWLRIAARYPVGYLAEKLARKGTGEERLSDLMDREPLVLARDRLGMLTETIPELPLPKDERRRLLAAARRSLAQSQMVTALDWAARGDGARARREAGFAFRIDRRVLRGSPLLVACAYLGSCLPAPFLRWMNRFRESARRALRRD